MDEPKELSPEEISVNQILEDSSKQIKAFKDQLRNLPSDKGPEPRPQGSPGSRPFGSRKHAEYRLRSGIEQVKSEAVSKADKVLENASPELKFSVGQKIESWKKPVKEGKEEKTFQESQNFMSRLMQSRKENNLSKDHASEKKEAEKREEHPFPSISTRFSQTLQYNQFRKDDGPEEPSDPTQPVIERDKDD